MPTTELKTAGAPDVSVRALLRTASPAAKVTPLPEPLPLPDPVFPQYPELLGRDNFVEHDSGRSDDGVRHRFIRPCAAGCFLG
jgi:hypothetical protein